MGLHYIFYNKQWHKILLMWPYIFILWRIINFRGQGSVHGSFRICKGVLQGRVRSHFFFRFPFFQAILMFLSILNQNPEKCITLSLLNIVKNIYDLIFWRITCFTKQIRNYNNTIYSKGLRVWCYDNKPKTLPIR